MEGGLKAPIRHPHGYDELDYLNEDQLDAELRRVFDICHGVDEEVIFSLTLPVYTSTTSATLSIFDHRLQPRKIIIVLTLCGRVALRKNFQNWQKSVKNFSEWSTIFG